MPHPSETDDAFPFDEGDAYRRGRRNPYPFTQTPQWVLVSGISPTAYFVYDLLNAHVNQSRKETTGDTAVWPGQETLAALARYRRDRSIRPYLTELEQLGAIDIHPERHPQDPMRRRNVYVVHETPPEGYERVTSLVDLYRELRLRLKDAPDKTSLADAYRAYDAANKTKPQVKASGAEGRSTAPPQGRSTAPRQGRRSAPEQDKAQPDEEQRHDAASRRSRAYGRRPSTGSRGGRPVENPGSSAAEQRARRADTARARKVLERALPRELAPQYRAKAERMPASVRAAILSELRYRTDEELIERVHRRWDLWFYAKGRTVIEKPVGCMLKLLANTCPDPMCEDGVLQGGQGKKCTRCQERRQEWRGPRAG